MAIDALALPTRQRFTSSKAYRLWCFALHLPIRFTVHFVKDFVFGALHFTCPSVSRFTSSKTLSLVLCTSPAHPFHGSLRQRLCLWCFALHPPTRFTVHFVKGLRPLVLCTSLRSFSLLLVF